MLRAGDCDVARGVTQAARRRSRQQGHSGISADARRSVPAGTVWTESEEEEWVNGVMEWWSDGSSGPTESPLLHHSNLTNRSDIWPPTKPFSIRNSEKACS